MTVKRGWEESTSGPDWIDVIGLMSAIGTIHSGRVAVTNSLAGIGFATTVVVKAEMTFELLPGSSLPPVVSVERVYPDQVSRTYSAFVFCLLYELDYAIGRAYNQETLWL